MFKEIPFLCSSASLVNFSYWQSILKHSSTVEMSDGWRLPNSGYTNINGTAYLIDHHLSWLWKHFVLDIFSFNEMPEDEILKNFDSFMRIDQELVEFAFHH